MSNVATSMTTSRPIGTAVSFRPSAAAFDHRFSRRSLQPSTAMRQPRDVAHRGEIRDERGESGLVTDRVAADHREAQPGAVGDRRGAVGAEVVALRRMHRERRQRVTRRRVHQREYPRQIRRVRARRRRPHQHHSGRHQQHVAEQIEGQEHRGEPAMRSAIAAVACPAVTGLPRKMPRAISTTAAKDGQSTRPDPCAGGTASRTG